MNKIFILDFDGVICDSHLECFYVAYKVIFKKNFDSFKYFFKQNKKKIIYYNRFVKVGADFCKVLLLLKLNRKYKNLMFKIDKKYERKFYIERQKIKKKNLKFWIQLNPFYKNIIRIFKNRINDDIFILSHKDFNSINILLKFNNIKIPIKNIFDKNKFKNKQTFLKRNFGKENLIYFFDDQIKNLINIKKKNIIKFLVLNNEKKYKGISHSLKKNNIKLLKQDKIESFIK
jgi:hypothetical protein